MIAVCGIGVVSSLGIGCDCNVDALMSQRCGIAPLSLFDSAVNVPVGEVKFTNHALKAMLDLDEKQTISRTALLGALAVGEALSDANIKQGKRVGLISSTTVGGMDLTEQFYGRFIDGAQLGKLRLVAGHDCATSTDFIAHHCHINGFRTTISTACSSAANAIMMGAELIKRDMLDYVVVGGVDALCRFTLNGFNSLMILDKTLCRPLDRDRKGLNLGEGAGYLVLTHEEDCHKRYCMLTGYANTNDAFHQTASSEGGEGAYMAMQQAMQMANIAPDEVDYINLHGTGTANNDASELAAVKRIFGNNVPPCSSTKAFTGHTLAAAGGVEAVFSVLSIDRGIRYTNLRFENEMENGIRPIANTEVGVEIHHVLSNSFGFGGSCSSLIFSKQ